MSLRSRLTLVLVVIMVLPMLLAWLLARSTFDRSLREQAGAELAGDQRVALDVLRVRTAAAARTARLLAGDRPLQQALRARDRAALRAAAARRAQGGLTVAVTDDRGRLLAQAGPAPRFLPGYAPPALDAVLAAAPGDPRRALFVDEFADVRRSGCSTRCGLGRIAAGFWTDGGELRRLRAGAVGSDLSVVVGGQVVSSTRAGMRAVRLPPLDPSRPAQVRLGGGEVLALASAWRKGLGADRAALLVSAPAGTATSSLRRLDRALEWLAALVVALVIVLGALLARMLSAPLRDLAEQARRTATGDVARPSRRTGATGEIGELARAFDALRRELGEHVRALHASRAELTRATARIGETLGSTGDLPKLLEVVLTSAVRARQARGGSLLLLDAERARLLPEATAGLGDGEIAAVAVGEGIVGAVAATGRAVVAPGPAAAPPVPGEPDARTQVSVPLRSRGTVLGVLSVYDRVPGGLFGEEDAAALAAFAGQAAVGIDNVRLHEEARRLSLTDEMTGIWNYRYFQLRIDQEIERARRFGRTLSLLLLDVDHFKRANDRHGHQQGDHILRELAVRVAGSIRDVDTFARYGGEEFVLILPETDLEGGRAAAEKLRERIGASPFGGAGGSPVGITVSVGVACYPAHARTAAELVEAADAAMYQAKLSGRDRVMLAGPVVLGPAAAARRPRRPATPR
ncbi:MAG TPA: diguanylate cyclase [Actinomycetes bacterium]|nr:diguanylate cyclase [Actinomycetes bacterium]